MGYIIIFIIIIFIIRIFKNNDNKEIKEIKEIKISDLSSKITESKFADSSNLENVEIPNSVTEIGRYAFAGCSSLKEIKIPNSITKIDDGVFESCSNLENVEIPNSVTEIGKGTFAGCSNLEEIKIPDSVTLIGDSAFVRCSKLKKIIIPQSVIKMEGSIFAGCSSLKEIIIPKSIKHIGENTFYKCEKLEKVIIPESVISIGNMAFSYCNSLREIEIPSSVTKFGIEIFKGCKNICIHCEKGSEAEKYAKHNKIHLKYIAGNNLQSEKNDKFKEKIDFLSAQAKSIIADISNTAYNGIYKIDKDELSYSIRVDIFDKKLNRANGNKNLYADSLKLNVLYYFNLIEDINKYITSCIKNNKFPTSGLEWESKFIQLQNSNKIHDINKAKNKDRLQAYNEYNSIDKLISNLEWDYTYFYINSSILIDCVGVISVNQKFVRPLLKESSSAIIKELEKCCHLKTSIILKSIEETLFKNKQNLAVNKPKSFREFYSNKTKEQLKNDVDEVYYSKLRELNLKDASFGTNGSKEFLGAIELALFEIKLKFLIEQGIIKVFTRDWGSLEFSDYMDEIVEKSSSITINEWKEAYRYFEKNHSWLDKHPCASPEVSNEFKKFKKLVDALEQKFILHNNNPESPERINYENVYTLQYAYKALDPYDDRAKYDTISLFIVYDKYGNCISKAIRTWTLDDKFSWCGYQGNKAISGSGKGIIDDITRNNWYLEWCIRDLEYLLRYFWLYVFD